MKIVLLVFLGKRSQEGLFWDSEFIPGPFMISVFPREEGRKWELLRALHSAVSSSSQNGLLVIREGSGAPAYKHLFYTASLKLFLHKLILQNQPDWPVHDKAKTNFIQNNSLDNFMRNGIIMSVKTEGVKTEIALNARNRKKRNWFL